MSYLGEIRMYAGSVEPLGWAFCQGQLLTISDNAPLFELIGTTYGGDGQTNFALPDLRGRVPIHRASNVLGAEGGEENVTLDADQLPVHNHALTATTAAGQNSWPGASGQLLATTSPIAPGVVVVGPGNFTVTLLLYADAVPDLPMNPGAILPSGGSQPHSNLQPWVAINFIISLEGVFPQSAVA